MRALLVCSLILISTSTARAQDTQGNTFNLQLFRPSVDSKGYFTVNASQILGHLDFSVGLIGTYAHDVLELHSPAASFRVSDFVTAQLQGALGLFKWAELGVSLPVHILFGSRGPAYVDPSNSNLNSDLTFGGQMVGDLGIHPKVRLLSSKYPVGLALVTSLYLPTGQSSKFLGEGNVSLRPELILDKEFGFQRRFRMALNTGALIRFARNTFTDRGSTVPITVGTGKSRSLGTQITYGLGLSGAVVPQKLDLIAELYGYADVTGSDPDGHHGTPLEWLAGAKVYLASKSYFEVGAGTGIIPDQTGSPEVRAFVGFIFEPSIGDRDGGSIKDPDPPVEKPRVPERHEPEPVEPSPDSDRDHDGIRDVDDLCPDEPEDYDGFEDTDGCPDPDNDKDRILDVDDKCPNEPETYNGFQDDDGCPDKGPVRVRRGVMETLGKIHFETGKATIQPISFPILDAVTATLKGNPELKLVEVQGHADERGDDDYNMQLTEDRAQAVKRYLIDHGIDADRLTAHGYGETRPTCRAHGERCWSKNRRVEFIILRQDGRIPGQEP